MNKEKIAEILMDFQIKTLVIAEDVLKRDGVFCCDCAKAQELIDKTVILLTKNI
jgi:hypothetical protein